MGIFQNNLMGAAAAAGGAAATGFYTHQIANSVRMQMADGSRLRYTPSGAGNRQTWSISMWVKRAKLGDEQFLYEAGTSGGSSTRLRLIFTDDDEIRITNSLANLVTSTAVFRDTSAWYHIMWKNTGGTNTVHVNGVQATTVSISGDTAINSTVAHGLGCRSTSDDTTTSFDGYIAEFVLFDGTAYSYTDVTDSKNGVLIPVDPSGLTLSGTNTAWLKFQTAADIDDDSSGNTNDYTASNISAHDQMLDSPTFGSEGSANFATINPLDPTIPLAAISNGNLQITEVASNRGAKANFAIPLTGKWYWEQYVYADSAQELWGGITGIDTDSSGDGRGGSSNSTTYAGSWSNYSGSNMYIRKFVAGTESAVSGSFGTTKDTILGITVNRDDNEIKCYKNNALQFTESISATQEYFPAGGLGGGTNATTINIFNFGQDGTFGGNETAQGNADGNGYGNFYYSPPTDFLALCSANLPLADAINPAETDDDYPQKLFSTTLYTGNNADQNINVGLQPDFIWLKRRDATYNNYLFDSSRGVTNHLVADNTGAQGSTAESLKAFLSTGYTYGDDATGNEGSAQMVVWSWRCNGGTTSTNDSSATGIGSIDSVMQTNTTIGFSLVTYTGTASNPGTVKHGLQVNDVATKPELLIIKNRQETDSWLVGSTKVTGFNWSSDYLHLQANSAKMTDAGGTGFNAEPTTIVFSVGSYLNYAEPYIAYCFASVEGFSKIGEYEGNGNADSGSFVYTGFRPSWIMTKSIDSTSDWQIFDDERDGYNVDNDHLAANTTATESTTDMLDILSNGFKMRIATDPNVAESYMYVAFAHNPFQYATAR